MLFVFHFPRTAVLKYLRLLRVFIFIHVYTMKLYLETKDYTLTGESFQLLHDPVLDMLVDQTQP